MSATGTSRPLPSALRGDGGDHERGVHSAGALDDIIAAAPRVMSETMNEGPGVTETDGDILGRLRDKLPSITPAYRMPRKED